MRGRGGAGFPAAIKWKTVAEAKAPIKYICCNADEGDSGTFADRMLMEGDPFVLLEGMTIAAHATGAREGYIYIRSEYPDAIATMTEAVRLWEEAGLGDGFELFVRRGAGAYICGEESSMLESLEGKRGVVRAKPPIPAISGLNGQPTVVNNVLTLASVPVILAKGAGFYKGYGMGRSRGTQAFQLAGNIARGGLVEKAFGVTLRELIETYGGGTATGKPVRAVQVGGPLGAYMPDLAAGSGDGLRGHGGCRRHARSRRHRGVRRHGGHGAAGPLRLRVLRHRKLRQVHALPHRRRARQGNRRQDHRRPGCRGEFGAGGATCARRWSTALSAPWAA